MLILLLWMMGFLLYSPFDTCAQAIADSTKTIKRDTTFKNHSSKKATLLSAVIPGTGQFYNKKYWKMPIIYGGFAIMIGVIKFNNDYYHTFSDAYYNRVVLKDSSADNYPHYTSSDLLTLRDYYRRNRDLTYILAGILYLLNVLDAYVDAELIKFDISDDLSLRARPFMSGFPGTNLTAGFKLTLNF